MLLDACISFCEALKQSAGPQITEWVCIAAIAALTWWRTRSVAKTAQAGIAAANEQASKAKAEVRVAQLSLARIEGSLRPSAPTAGVAGSLLPPRLGGPGTESLEGTTSRSGTYQPVLWPELPAGAPGARPSVPEPSLVDPTFPRPSGVPSLDEEDPPTNPDRPNARG